MANISNNNLFFNSSLSQKQMESKLNNSGNNAKSASKTKECFDNFISIKDDVSSDNSAINSAIKKAENNVKNSETNKTAKERAGKRAKTFAKNTSWGNYTVATNAKQSNNSIKFKIKDKNGKTGNATVRYGSDNSKIVTININGITTKKVYDSRGILRQLTSNDKSTGNTTIKKYDETGKINSKKIQDTKTGTIKSLSCYDDTGELARKNTYNEGGQISSTTDYEYNSKGTLTGSYTTIKSGSDKSGKVKAICTTYNNKKRTTVTYNTDGSSEVVNSTKNTKTGKYETNNKTKYDNKGNVVKPKQQSNTAEVKTDNAKISTQNNTIPEKTSKEENNNTSETNLRQDNKTDSINQIDFKTAGLSQASDIANFGFTPGSQTIINRKLGSDDISEKVLGNHEATPVTLTDEDGNIYTGTKEDKPKINPDDIIKKSDSTNFGFTPGSQTIINRKLGGDDILGKITDNHETTPVTLTDEDGNIYTGTKEDKPKINPDDIIKKSDSTNLGFVPSSSTLANRRIDINKILGNVTKVEQQTTPATLIKVDDIKESSENIE